MSVMENYSTEEQLQADCYQWFHNTHPELRRTLFAVPNGGERPAKIIRGKRVSLEGNRLKATGTIPGPSDLILVLYCVVAFIEMKLPGHRQSPEQIDFEQKVKERGHSYIVLTTFAGFKQYVTAMLRMYGYCPVAKKPTLIGALSRFNQFVRDLLTL